MYRNLLGFRDATASLNTFPTGPNSSLSANCRSTLVDNDGARQWQARWTLRGVTRWHSVQVKDRRCEPIARTWAGPGLEAGLQRCHCFGRFPGRPDLSQSLRLAPLDMQSDGRRSRRTIQGGDLGHAVQHVESGPCIRATSPRINPTARGEFMVDQRASLGDNSGQTCRKEL